LERRCVLRAKTLGDPNYFACSDSSCVGKDLTEVGVVGFFKLILDDYLVVTVRAKDVELEVTHLVLHSHAFQFAEPNGVGEQQEVVIFRQPRREITGFVPPRVAEGDFFQST
jgi:hypothetical protein